MPLPKSFIAGMAMLLIGVAGFLYNTTRPLPPVKSLPTEDLHAAETQPQPTATPEPSPASEGATIESSRPSRIKTKIVKASSARTRMPRQTPPPKSYKIYLASPSMAETYSAPASVRLKAVIRRTAGDAVKKVEFLYRLAGSEQSFCRSLSKPSFKRASLTDATLAETSSFEDRFKGLNSIGETTHAPYETSWKDLQAGTYTIVAVATYESGEQQVSPQVVIVVNEAEVYEGKEWEGWRPEHDKQQQPEQDVALMPTPTPTPTLDMCPQITVSNLSEPQPRGEVVKLKASLTGGELPAEVKYEWETSAGTIVEGQGTPDVSINTNGVFDETLIAGVEVRGLNAICPNTGSLTVPFVRPRRLTQSARNALAITATTNDGGMNWLPLAHELRADNASQAYIILRSRRDSCVDNEIFDKAHWGKDYLVKTFGIEPARIVVVNAGSGENAGDQPVLERWLVPFGADPPAFKRDAAGGLLPLVACRTTAPAARVSNRGGLNRACPDLIEEVDYYTRGGKEFEVNTCPHNRRDPQNASAQRLLGTSVRGSVLANFPTFKYWTNGGKILASDGTQALWDLSNVRLRPGPYTAIVKADDACDCESVSLHQVKVTNFCTPCVKLPLPTISPDCALQTFTLSVREFAVDRTTTFHWTTTKGEIISGQGTPSVTIDTSKLDEGTPFTVTVGVGGLYRYCVNKLSQQSIVYRGSCPSPRQFDEFPSIAGGENRIRLARRRRREGREAQTPPAVTVEEAQRSPDTPTDNGDSATSEETRPKEKEWIDVAWSPRVEVERSFPVVVIYKRTEEMLEVKNEAGEILESLKLEDTFKLLKERYGKDYEVLAQVRLRTSGFRCDGCGDELFQSLESRKVEWSWSLTSYTAGKQTFNLEMLIKGVPRGSNSDEGAKRVERVWGKNGLEVDVFVPFFTKYRLHALSFLFAFTGVGFSLKGMKIIYRRGDTYNVGQAVAVGRNVQMNNTTVNQQQDGMTVEQKEQNRDG